MGGCRCTYRNCTVKSDGKTHMFHYPVFEKLRCHQWLLNAHRLDFLNLKVSQLKNRVICQNHFKDENFMNFKKDKLTFDAVPTENGPFCDTTNYVSNNQDSSKLLSIIIDDIENEYITGNEKKANYSMKYGDFLANLDFMDLEKIDEDVTGRKHIDSCLDILPRQDNLMNDDSSFSFKLSLPDKSDKRSLTHPMLAVSPYISSSNVKKSAVPNYNSYQRLRSDNISVNAKDNIVFGNTIQNKPTQQEVLGKKQPKITIISEKTITDPVPVTGKFEPVSPNFVLNAPKTKTDIKEFKDKLSKDTTQKEINIPERNSIIEIEIEPMVKEEDKPSQTKLSQHTEKQESSVDRLQNNILPKMHPKVLLSKPKVPPERVDAINRKRKFNMKLRDMVESCLDKLENCEKLSEQVKPINSPKNKTHKKKIQVQSLPTETVHKVNHQRNSDSQEYTIAFLEARMRKMENTLLEKIEQNSKKITDLKQTFKKDSPKKSSNVRIKIDEETHKKQLFQEISQYLSPRSKNLIYEELFINKFVLGDAKTLSKRKRRRCVI